jgi:hypothetical protein
MSDIFDQVRELLGEMPEGEEAPSAERVISMMGTLIKQMMTSPFGPDAVRCLQWIATHGTDEERRVFAERLQDITERSKEHGGLHLLEHFSDEDTAAMRQTFFALAGMIVMCSLGRADAPDTASVEGARRFGMVASCLAAYLEAQESGPLG